MIEIPGYTIEKEIGRGGMAVVYLAVQESLGRKVALKVLQSSLATDPSFSKRFIAEGKMVAALSHPHIVSIYDVGVTNDNQHYIVMEYIESGSLKERLAIGAIAPDTAARIVASISEALDYAHQAGLVHRDVKPDNILFRPNGDPVLSDFGIALTSGTDTRLTQVGSTIGTPQYMSPEQAKGEQCSGASDYYSLGIILYECLTGNVPFDGDNGTAIGIKHIQEISAPLPAHLFSFQEIINALLEKIPAKRMQQSWQVKRSLEQAMTNQSIPQQQRSGMHNAAWALGGSLLAITLVAIGYWWFSTYSSQTPVLPGGGGSTVQSGQEISVVQPAQPVVTIQPQKAVKPLNDTPVTETISSLILLQKQNDPEPWKKLTIPWDVLSPGIDGVLPMAIMRLTGLGRFIDAYRYRTADNSFRMTFGGLDNGEFRSNEFLEMVAKIEPGKISRIFGHLFMRPSAQADEKKKSHIRERIPPVSFDFFWKNNEIELGEMVWPGISYKDLGMRDGVEISPVTVELKEAGFGKLPYGELRARADLLRIVDSDIEVVIRGGRIAITGGRDNFTRQLGLDVQFDSISIYESSRDDRRLVGEIGASRCRIDPTAIGRNPFQLQGKLTVQSLRLRDSDEMINFSDIELHATLDVPDVQLVNDLLEITTGMIRREMDPDMQLRRPKRRLTEDQLERKALQLVSSGLVLRLFDTTLSLSGGGKLIGEGSLTMLPATELSNDDDLWRHLTLKMKLNAKKDTLTSQQMPINSEQFFKLLFDQGWEQPGTEGNSSFSFVSGKKFSGHFFINDRDMESLNR